METGLRVFLLTLVLAALPGCATVRGWFHHGHTPAEPTEAQADRKSVV